MSSPERGIWLDDATHREDLATFVERAVRLDDAAVIRLRERPGGSGGGLGRNRFRRAGQPGGGGPGATGRPERRRRRARPGPGCDGPQRSRRPGISDGLGMARRAAARHRLRPHRRRARAGGAGSGAARRRAGEGARQLTRAAGVAARPGGTRGQLRARRRRHPDALRIRLDRNGFPAAVVGSRARAWGLDPETVAADEIVRVRALPAWLRIDARFGSVYRRRGDPALVLR